VGASAVRKGILTVTFPHLKSPFSKGRFRGIFQVGRSGCPKGYPTIFYSLSPCGKLSKEKSIGLSEAKSVGGIKGEGALLNLPSTDCPTTT
jgi:hypothetical protein